MSTISRARGWPSDSVDTTLQQALVWLAERGVADQQRECGSRDSECRAQAERHGFYPINDKTLEELLSREPHTGDVHCQGTWLFLPAPRKGSLRLPIINVIYDYNRDPAEIRMQIAIFYKASDEAFAMGWRFESPEHGGEEGEQSAHGFYHAQPSHSLRTLSRHYDLPVADAKVPDGQPAFPLDATDEVDLLLCLLLSIYGLKEASELVGDATVPDLAQRLRQLPALCVVNER